MTNKFDKLYENIKVGFPISVQNPSREVPYAVGYDMGQELNDERLAHVDDLINDNGRLTNPYHPTNLKVRSYMNQLKVMSTNELIRLSQLLGMQHAEVHHNDDIINAIVNHLGENPENWKVLSPYIFTESEDEDELDETSEDDSEWVSQKSHDDNWMESDEEDDEMDEAVVKDDKFRKGKKVTVTKSDRDDHKVIDGKEVKMSPAEMKNREKAATDREKQGNVAQKRMKSFKKTMQVKRQSLRK
jgi:hypothetical protein